MEVEEEDHQLVEVVGEVVVVVQDLNLVVAEAVELNVHNKLNHNLSLKPKPTPTPILHL